MTPVMQTKLHGKDGAHNGNCLAAALASLLDLPLWMVPPFEDMFGRSDWRARIDAWLSRLLASELKRVEGHVIEDLPEFYIASGLSPRGVRHSVIYRSGALAHDPHPSGAGILEVEWCWFVSPIVQRCGECGGHYRFDTTINSDLWNRVIRNGGPERQSEFLCTACIVRAFALVGESFDAELFGDEFNGVPVSVRIGEVRP